jgi:hypothetical protein
MTISRSSVYLILYSKRQVRSFLLSGAFQHVLKQENAKMFVSEKLIDEVSLVTEKFEILPKVYHLTASLDRFVHLVALWRYRDKGMLYKVRAICQFGKRKERDEWKSVLNYEIENWGEARRFLVRFCAHTYIFNLLNHLRKFVFKIESKKTVWNLSFSQSDTNIMLIPYGGHLSDYPSFLINFCKAKGIKAVLLQENWDNLNSKYFLLDEPDIFLTWGKQSSSFLRTLQGFEKCKVIEAGSPLRMRSHGSRDGTLPEVLAESFEGKVKIEELSYVLVTGTGDGIEDLDLLKTIFEKLAIKDEIHIIFRPHPFSRNKLNKEVAFSIDKRILYSDSAVKEQIETIQSLVANAILVVNYFSTVALQALLNHKPVILPTFGGLPNANYKWDRVANEATHWTGILALNGVTVVESREELQDAIHQLISEKVRNTDKCTQSNLQKNKNLSWFCEAVDYPKVLLHTVNKHIDSTDISLTNE